MEELRASSRKGRRKGQKQGGRKGREGWKGVGNREGKKRRKEGRGKKTRYLVSCFFPTLPFLTPSTHPFVQFFS